MYSVMNFCKNTFHISHVHISQKKIQSIIKWDLEHIIFISRGRYWQILKSALVYLYGILFLHGILHFDKFEVADFKYVKTFLNLQPKIPPKMRFWLQICIFLFFGTSFCTSVNSRMLISNTVVVFQIYRLKYLKKAFLAPFFVFPVIAIVLLLDFYYLEKLKSADFKHDISFFKYQSKNSKKNIFGSNIGNLYFCTKFCILINSWVLIWNMPKFFKLTAQNYTN